MFVHASLHLELWYDAIETQLEHKMRSRITDNGESGIRRRSKNPFRRENITARYSPNCYDVDA